MISVISGRPEPEELSCHNTDGEECLSPSASGPGQEIVYAGSSWYRCPPVEFWQSGPIRAFVTSHGPRGHRIIHGLLGAADNEGRGTRDRLIAYLRETNGQTRFQWQRWQGLLGDLAETGFVYCYGDTLEYWLLPGHALLDRNPDRKFSTVPLPLNLSLMHEAGGKLAFIEPYVHRLVTDIAVKAIKTHVNKGVRIPCNSAESLPIAQLARLYPDLWEKAHGAASLEASIEKRKASPRYEHMKHMYRGDGPKAAPQFKRRGRKLGE